MPVERQVQGVNGSAAAMRVCAAHPETMRDGPKVHAGGLHQRRKAGPVIFVTWRPGSQDPGRFRYGSASYGLVENARKTRDHHALRASSFQGLHTSRARRTAGQYIVDQHDVSIMLVRLETRPDLSLTHGEKIKVPTRPCARPSQPQWINIVRPFLEGRYAQPTTPVRRTKTNTHQGLA